MTKDFWDDLIVRLNEEHPETVFQALMYAIVRFIDSFRKKGNSIPEILNKFIESLNDEMKVYCSVDNINRNSSGSKNLVYNWNKAQKIGESILAHHPTAQLKDAANFYAKIVIGWAFVYPMECLSLQSRIEFSGEESEIEIAGKIVDYFIWWLCMPDWQD